MHGVESDAAQVSVEGLKTLPSDFAPRETLARLEAEIKAHGMNVFARINHAALAAEVGLTLQPTEVILFGNPRAGTPLMQANQTIGIELPLKALVWQDPSGKVWLSYKTVTWLAKRHGLAEVQRATAMDAALIDIATKATKVMT